MSEKIVQTKPRGEHDWSITVVANPKDLVELLWLRHHCFPSAGSDLPIADLPDVENAAARPAGPWDVAWEGAVSRLVSLQMGEDIDFASDPELWDSRHPRDLADSIHVDLREATSWRQQLQSADGAERDVDVELRAAWMRGLRLIIELPLRSDYARMIAPGVLVVSARTRSRALSYVNALRDAG